MNHRYLTLANLWASFAIFCTALLASCLATSVRDPDLEAALNRIGADEPARDVRVPTLEAAQSAPPDSALEQKLATNPTIEDVQQAAARRNPDLKAALETWLAFLEKAPQRSAPPYPSFRFGYSSMFLMNEFELMQEVPFPTKLVAETKAALAEARAAGGDFRERENVLRQKAAAAYASLFLARRELEIVDANLAILERFAETARAKYNAGTAGEPDVLRAEVDREALRSERALVARAVEIAQSGLNILLDRPPDALIGQLAPLPLPAPPDSKSDDYGQALEHRPEMAAAAERVTAAGYMRDRAQAEWFPDFVVGAGYVRDFGNDENEVEVTAGITIPLWWGAIRARIREADADVRRSKYEARSTRNRILDELKSASARASATAERFLRLEREVLPRAAENLRVSETAYLSGKIDFLALLDAERMLLMRQLERERALADFTTSKADLERAMGSKGSP